LATSLLSTIATGLEVVFSFVRIQGRGDLVVAAAGCRFNSGYAAIALNRTLSVVVDHPMKRTP
jgi:hypothetical protein